MGNDPVSEEDRRVPSRPFACMMVLRGVWLTATRRMRTPGKGTACKIVALSVESIVGHLWDESSELVVRTLTLYTCNAVTHIKFLVTIRIFASASRSTFWQRLGYDALRVTRHLYHRHLARSCRLDVPSTFVAEGCVEQVLERRGVRLALCPS
jgi:hypothetical protein